VTQTRDCSTALSNQVVLPLTFAFDAMNSVVTNNGWTSFFNNADSTNCAITSCSLKAQDGLLFSGEHISIAGTYPWELSVNVNIPAGWNETIDVECTNGDQAITLDNFVVS